MRMKSLEDWLSFLERLHPKGQAGIELGLERVSRVKAELQQTQRCPLIIVGGTNGKGSSCAYLEAIYHFAGYRVGCYTSPHLLAYTERVRVDRVAVDEAALCQAFARVESARQAAGNSALTYFEFGTLAAWEVFAAAQVDVIILEVGLGGRLDAVNVYDADCAIVTGIALDHTDWLGPTRESIGFEKAGIYRPGTPAICADPEPPQTLLAHAAAIGAELRLLGRDFGYFGDKTQWTFWQRDPQAPATQPLSRRGGLANPALRGACQLRNAAAVLTAVEALKARLPVSMQAIRRGLMEPEIKGRFQVIPGRPVQVLDVAHNPQAVAVLAENLGEMGFCEKTYAVVGMLADKDMAGALAALAGKIDVWLLATLDVPRGASAETLAAVVDAGRLGGRVECCASPEEAFMRAAKQAGENDRILTFGSFYTVAAVMRAMKRSA
jgi:dihydrofolate synthase/folylpolyglutamate synthase